MVDSLAMRAAHDLEGAYPPCGWRDPSKASMSRDLRMTSPTRPPWGGRARPGVNPGGKVFIKYGEMAKQ